MIYWAEQTVLRAYLFAHALLLATSVWVLLPPTGL